MFQSCGGNENPSVCLPKATHRLFPPTVSTVRACIVAAITFTRYQQRAASPLDSIARSPGDGNHDESPVPAPAG